MGIEIGGWIKMEKGNERKVFVAQIKGLDDFVQIVKMDGYKGQEFVRT